MDSDKMDQEENKVQGMEHNCVSENDGTVLESQEIHETEDDIIYKGDTIGETLYSAKWVLNTLISLSKVYEDGWNESIENDLCILWDMTTEKDIVEFLLENDFFKMAEFILKTSEESRLTEIIVGIIGNMCCETKSLKILVNATELVTLILSLIESDDKEILIQVLRILQAALWDIQKNRHSLWLKKIEECTIIGDAISFILKSSTSDELLTPTIDLVYLISEIELPSNNNNFIEDVFDVDQLISALSESMIELINQEDNPHTSMHLKNIDNWLKILFNIMKKELLKFSDSETDENFQKINTVLLKILKPYTISSNLVPSDDRCIFCIQECIKLAFFFQKNEMILVLELIQVLIQIMINVNPVTTEHEFEECDDFKQLYYSSTNFWIETLNVLSKDQILEVLQKFRDRDAVNTVVELTKSLSEIPEESINNLLQVYNELLVLNCDLAQSRNSNPH